MASKRRLRRRQCEGKVRHKTKADAWAAIRTMHRKHGYCGNLQPYPCKFCGGWHVGHRKGGQGIYKVLDK